MKFYISFVITISRGKGGKASAPLVIIPDRPLEVFTAGSEAVAAVSQAVCACAAIANNIPIYRHVGNLSRTKVSCFFFFLLKILWIYFTYRFQLLCRENFLSLEENNKFFLTKKKNKTKNKKHVCVCWGLEERVSWVL